MKRKIALLYICTGKYDIFWNDFYKSSEEYFCKGLEKHYFVFTDSTRIKPQKNISLISQDNLGWPLNSLFRYKMFLRIKDELLNFDFVTFINGNGEFKSAVSFEDFFGNNKTIVACLHPGFYNKPSSKFTYERRESSLAKVTNEHFYFAGGINGGKSDVFLFIIEQIARNIENDLCNGVMALWHDESHWNAFINNNYESLKNNLHILTPSYMYPAGWKLDFEIKILLRDKNDYFKVNNEKGIASSCSFMTYIKKVISRVMK